MTLVTSQGEGHLFVYGNAVAARSM